MIENNLWRTIINPRWRNNRLKEPSVIARGSGASQYIKAREHDPLITRRIRLVVLGFIGSIALSGCDTRTYNDKVKDLALDYCNCMKENSSAGNEEASLICNAKMIEANKDFRDLYISDLNVDNYKLFTKERYDSLTEFSHKFSEAMDRECKATLWFHPFARSRYQEKMSDSIRLTLLYFRPHSTFLSDESKKKLDRIKSYISAHYILMDKYYASFMCSSCESEFKVDSTISYKRGLTALNYLLSNGVKFNYNFSPQNNFNASCDSPDCCILFRDK